MANDTRRPAGRQSRWGICTNPNCPNYRQKIEIERGDLVCPEENCKKPLSPCAPPSKKKSAGEKYGKKAAIVVAALAVLGGGGFGIAQLFKGGEEVKPDTDLQARLDSIARADSIAAAEAEAAAQAKQDSIAKAAQEAAEREAAAQAAAERSKPQGGNIGGTTTPSSGKSTGAKSLGYGTYKGEMQNGQPHGTGTLTFTTSHVIDSRDSKGRVAEAGDYVSGLFYQGHVETAKWYGADGSLKGSLLLGRP